MPFPCWKDHSDNDVYGGMDGNGGAAGQSGHAYEVTIRYKLV